MPSVSFGAPEILWHNLYAVKEKSKLGDNILAYPSERIGFWKWKFTPRTWNYKWITTNFRGYTVSMKPCFSNMATVSSFALQIPSEQEHNQWAFKWHKIHKISNAVHSNQRTGFFQTSNLNYLTCSSHVVLTHFITSKASKLWWLCLIYIFFQR